jgi:hypothetical protein
MSESLPNVFAPTDTGKLYAQALMPLPPVGALPGKLTTNPELTGFAPGQPRPFGPGEYLENPNGSWSNEISVTIPAGAHMPLNQGRSTVVPTLWVHNGHPVRVDPATAAQYAAQSGLQFPSFDSEDDAASFADKREQNWQAEGSPGDLTRSVPSLWTRPVKR